MKAFYFGPTVKRLFGAYHPPESGSKSRTGVVLCYPMGYEYNWAHRAFRQLAGRLSKAGFPVLRFDYYGCGDSDGEDTDGHVDQWISDIAMAIDELKEIASVSQISLVGLRLGASLNLLIASEKKEVNSLVLWEPILDGKSYLEKLKKLQENWKIRHDLPLNPIEQLPSDEIDAYQEIVGFPLTRTNQGILKEMNLFQVKKKPAENIFLVRNDTQLEDGSFIEHLKRLGGSVEYQLLTGQRVWVEEGIDGRVFVPYSVLKSIVDWLCKVSQ